MKTLIRNTLFLAALNINLYPVLAEAQLREPASGDVELFAEPDFRTMSSATPLWESATSQGKSWTEFVDRELDQRGSALINTVPADASTFCPNYQNLSQSNRKAFWTFLISAMTRFESGFNPNTKYTENFADSRGRKVVSRGLLQISIESANSYGCGFREASELHDPQKNLSCGIRILSRWMTNDRRIAGKVNGGWRGGARYWSVLRTTNTRAYPSILKWSRALSICQN